MVFTFTHPTSVRVSQVKIPQSNMSLCGIYYNVLPDSWRILPLLKAAFWLQMVSQEINK